MQNDILYTVGLDQNNQLIHIDYAKKGDKYSCPGCKGEFILKKSGKTGKGSKRPHFAHHNQPPNCTAESVLHLSFKKMVVEYLNDRIKQNNSVIIEWNCINCQIDYSNLPLKRDLLNSVAHVKEEYNLKQCRPDIALLDKEQRVIGVIEIVVTHEPEERTLNFYREQGITLIQLNITPEDLRNLESKIGHPDVLNYCLNINCNQFINHKVRRRIEIGQTRCPNCRNIGNTARVTSGSVFGVIQSNVLTSEEKQNIIRQGVFLIDKSDKTFGSYSFPACKKCSVSNPTRRLKPRRRF